MEKQEMNALLLLILSGTGSSEKTKALLNMKYLFNIYTN